MLDRDGFRPNVGIILCNSLNQVFWGKRIRTHSWQFPQGGIDRGETPEQAMFHFVNGYTAKIAGTEVGVKEPQATFSPCFGGPFLVWHPQKYADLLADRIRKHRKAIAANY